MSTVEGIVSAIGATDADEAKRQALMVLRGPAEADGPSAIERVELALEVGDWLLEQGKPERAGELYEAALGLIETVPDLSAFEKARWLDKIAEGLISAGRLQKAEATLRRSAELTRTDVDLDGRAVLWRLNRSREIARAEALPPKAEVEMLERRLGVRELSITRDVASAPGMAPARPARVEPTDTHRYRKLADALAQVPDSNKYLKVAVHFATHRQPRPQPNPLNYNPYEYFGHEPSDKLVFGRAIVTVPAERVAGHYEEPSSGWFGLGNGGALDKSFTVQTIDVLDGEIMLGEVNSAVGASRRKEILVYLHGYYTSFARGLMRTAQLKVDMKIEGPAILYSLPSKGTFLGYGHDRVNAQLVVAHEQLAEFLKSLCESSGTARIHLVAHSLGCEMLLHTLSKLAAMSTGSSPRFGEVVFAAPDVDQLQFRTLMPRVVGLARRVTVYASRRDIPLWVMSTFVDRDRAGYDAADLAGIKGVDVVDTTKAAWDFWGHTDFAAKTVDDVRAVVWLSLTPAGRRSRLISRATAGGLPYWAFEPAEPPGIFRKALEWARELGLDRALRAAQDGVAAESAMIPPGERLAEFTQLRDELSVFLGARGDA